VIKNCQNISFSFRYRYSGFGDPKITSVLYPGGNGQHRARMLELKSLYFRHLSRILWQRIPEIQKKSACSSSVSKFIIAELDSRANSKYFAWKSSWSFSEAKKRNKKAWRERA